MAALLDSPPPSPQLQSASTPPPSFGSLSPDAPMTPQPDMSGLLQLAMSIDDSLLLLAQAAPAGAPELAQARDLIKAALAKVMTTTSAMGTPAMPTGTSPGNQFPGAPPGVPR